MIYKELADAEHDLKLFSCMNCNEGKVLFLVNVLGGLEITKTVPSAARCEAMALNGQIFPRAPQ